MAAEMSLAALRHAATLPDWESAAASFADAVLELIDGTVGVGDDSHEPGHFPAAWLDLREPVDHRSRAESLVSALTDRWRTETWRRVLDLGSGTGSNLRYLASRLPPPQTWALVDHDADLLARVEDRLMDGVKAFRALGDLSAVGLRLVHASHLVTASALLDLMSHEWLEALVEACRNAGCGALFALTYDGRIEWSPSVDPDDELVRDAVNDHQRRDKGVGPALGPTATTAAERLFREAGFEVQVAPSPWRLGPDDQALTVALIEGWAAAAGEQRPEDAPRIREWAARRATAVRGGGVTVEVGHLDLLALPEAQ
jgi:hypothetical protein